MTSHDQEQQNMVNPRIIIVTGANRGIGKAICQSLLNTPNIGPLKLFATSRTGSDLSLKLSDPSSQKIVYSQLDISSSQSIREFGERVRQQGGQVGVLVNNAGVNLDQEYGVENAKRTLDVNFRGTVEMCQTFIPLISSCSSSSGRIVNLASIASRLNIYSPKIQSRLLDPNTTLSDLESLATDFETAVSSATEERSGFSSPGRSYNISKALLRAATRILAGQNPDVLINCCCPGWIDTDMGGLISSRGTRPPKTVQEGARIPVRLAVGDIGSVSGEYWANESVRGKGEGEVQGWE